VIYTEKGFAIFKIAEIKKEGPQPFEEVKNSVITRVKLEKQKQRAREFASSVQEKINDNTDLRLITTQDTQNIMKFDSTSEFSLTSSVPGLGLDHIFNSTAFSLTEGQISDMIETNRGLYWQQLLSKTAFDSSAFLVQKESIRQRLLNQKRNQAFADWYQYLKDRADIVDNRKLFNL